MTPRQAMKKRVWLYKDGWYDFLDRIENGNAITWRYMEKDHNFRVFENWDANDDLLDYDGCVEKKPPEQRKVIEALFERLR
jgi:hypothetical protein